MKELINEHDMTKKMMDIIKGDYRTKLNEESEDQKDTKEYSSSDPVYQEELKKIKDTVDSSIEIKNFNSYINPNNKNVIMIGQMSFGTLEFRFELVKQNVEVTTLKPYDLTDENVEKITKITGYFKNWKDEWTKKITEEMQQKNM